MKGLLFIHQCVDPNIFEKIIKEETNKGVQDTLKNMYRGDAKLKKVKFRSLRKQYENI